MYSFFLALSPFYSIFAELGAPCSLCATSPCSSSQRPCTATLHSETRIDLAVLRKSDPLPSKAVSRYKNSFLPDGSQVSNLKITTTIHRFSPLSRKNAHHQHQLVRTLRSDYPNPADTLRYDDFKQAVEISKQKPVVIYCWTECARTFSNSLFHCPNPNPRYSSLQIHHAVFRNAV